MKTIQFFGAAGTVTGSCALLTGVNGVQILVDLGMFQENDEIGKLNHERLPFDIAKISAVLLTHAHLDHSGRLPLLVKAGYAGKIYMTKATRMLAALILEDAAKVALENNNKGIGTKELLYSEEDVDRLLTKIETREYDEKFKINEFEIVFRDAGHILGSAIIEITNSIGRKIVFSGDLGNTPEDLIGPTEKINQADFVVMESTYGSRLHIEENPSEVLMEEINEIEKSKGVLLIPSFSIERAQELLHRINHLKNENKISKDTQVFLDSPMAIKATEIFRRSPDLYNSELSHELKTDDPFDFPGLTLCEDSKESKDILLVPAPKVIISGSGMMHGGRILHHALNYLPDFKTRLLLVGYQAQGTLGRLLQEGMTRVRIYDQEVRVRAHVRMLESMSCHADQKKLLQWLGSIKGIKKLFLNHGDEDARKALALKIKTDLNLKNIESPQIGQFFNLG